MKLKRIVFYVLIFTLSWLQGMEQHNSADDLKARVYSFLNSKAWKSLGIRVIDKDLSLWFNQLPLSNNGLYLMIPSYEEWYLFDVLNEKILHAFKYPMLSDTSSKYLTGLFSMDDMLLALHFVKKKSLNAPAKDLYDGIKPFGRIKKLSTLVVFDIKAHTYKVLTEDTDSVRALAFNATNSQLATINNQNQWVIWDMSNYSLKRFFSIPSKKTAQTLAFNQEGNQLFIGFDMSIQEWGINSGQLIRKMKIPALTQICSMALNASLLLGKDKREKYVLMDGISQTPIKDFEVGVLPTISPNGLFMLTCELVTKNAHQSTSILNQTTRWKLIDMEPLLSLCSSYPLLSDHHLTLLDHLMKNPENSLQVLASDQLEKLPPLIKKLLF